MENNPNLPNHISMQEVLRMAASPAGQQLIAMLRKQSDSTSIFMETTPFTG